MALCIQVTYPVLYARTPNVFFINANVELVYAMIFYVGRSSVSSRFQLLFLCLANCFGRCSCAANAVIYSRGKNMVVFEIQIVVDPEATIPIYGRDCALFTFQFMNASSVPNFWWHAVVNSGVNVLTNRFNSRFFRL